MLLSHLSFSKGSHAQQRGVEGAFTLTKRAEWKVGRPPCVRGHFRVTAVGWGPRTPPHTPCKLGLVRHASWLQIPPRLRLGDLWGPPRNSGFASSPPEATGKAGVDPRRHPAPEVPSASALPHPPLPRDQDLPPPPLPGPVGSITPPSPGRALGPPSRSHGGPCALAARAGAPRRHRPQSPRLPAPLLSPRP